LQGLFYYFPVTLSRLCEGSLFILRGEKALLETPPRKENKPAEKSAGYKGLNL
jgi:hypothetical protein